ncbi:deoxycytidine triphosphate deaminase [Mesorhizobium sp. B4-1-3]|uniref:dCTP deaminase domain-containing protein n=1 Tax=Mesorhizobium sp. B4-1-3 TaxID=2589889 RepID=UPI0015E2B968|nr:deoxycytidine triphosphate deaminase [Mesorhizobium sp. B4-1-3]
MADNSTSPSSYEPASGFWSDGTWKALKSEDAPVKPFKLDGVDRDGANYNLAIGEEVYVSSLGSGKTVQKLSEGEAFSIAPGQFAFILTEEEVALPFDKIGFISIRASTKFLGLVNISGFHVDPGYKGKLIFAVYNAGPTIIHLRRGDRIFPLWITNLDKKMQRTAWKVGHDKIPASMITAISGEFTTAYQLAEKLKVAQEDIVQLKSFKVYLTAILAVLFILITPFLKDAASNVVNTFWPSIKCAIVNCVATAPPAPAPAPPPANP